MNYIHVTVGILGRTTSAPISAHRLVLDKVLDFDPELKV